MEVRVPRNWLVPLLVISCCATVLALEPVESRGSIGGQSSSHRSQSPQRIRLPRRLSTRRNEIASTEPVKRTSQLVGGHSRTETSPPETTSTTAPDNESTLEDALLLSSTSNGKEQRKSSTASSSSSSDDDDKKTLSQQVKEGKYGLIQNEIYPDKPRRPGIISYSSNPEVPRDTAKNLGGLDEEEIWLAENHVLVLKGGSFPDEASASEQSENGWPPIDDYEAPRRQVKIPPRPKVPPPFPVQLVEGGPVQLIGTNSTSLIENGTIDFEALPGGFKGFLPGEGPYFPFPTPGGPSSGSPEKKTKAEGPPASFYPALPPGAVIVPPPSNQTDYDDEDQSIYYPPPYSFVYPSQNRQQDAGNSTAIPPGPLVPGIILPPPPDFFSALDDDDGERKQQQPSTAKDKPAKSAWPSTTPLPSRAPSYLPPRKSSTKLYKTASVTDPSRPVKSSARSKLKTSTYLRYRPEKTTTTSPPPLESSTATEHEYRIEQILGNRLIETSTEKPWKTFYATSTPSSVEQPVETTPSSVQGVLTTSEKPPRYPSQASYYFYEESPSSTIEPLVFFGTTAESPASPTPPPYYNDKKEYYDVEGSKDYNVKLIDSIVKDPGIFRYLDSGATSSQDKYETQTARSQSPRMLPSSEPLYYQPAPTRPSTKLGYFASPKPKTGGYYRPRGEAKPTVKSKAIYQYSFEATNYAKRGGQPSALSRPEIEDELPPPPQIQQPRRQKEVPIYQEYQDIQTVSEQYGDYGTERKLPPPPPPSYLASQKKERSYYHRSTTASPVRDTTLAAHQQYFTKQDEQLLDDVTKEYFTMFGKKLSGKLPSTTPIYGKSSVTERPAVQFAGPNSYADYSAPNIKVRYGDQTPGPYSLADDVRVNFERPLPPIEPESEFVPVASPRPVGLTQKYAPRPVLQVRDYALQPVRQRLDQLRGYNAQRVEQQQQQQQQQPIRGYPQQRPISLEGDIAVNYKNPRPPVNPDAEYIGTGAVPAGADKPSSYFAYRLPGDGGHFYFLTPQAIGREDPSGAYLYSRPRGSRLLRSRRRGRRSE